MEFRSKYWTELDVHKFGKMLSNKQNSHKFYFFPVIVDAMNAGKKAISFNDVAERMIAEAWYPVTEHFIHLGQFKNNIPNDSIEQFVLFLSKKLNVKSDIGSEALIKEIKRIEKKNPEIQQYKQDILRYAPVRLLSPFLEAKETDYQRENRIYQIIDSQNRNSSLPYTINRDSNGFLDRIIVFDPEWSKFIKDNYIEIRGWINNERLTYLQKRNPQMPGLVFKMKPIKRDRQLEDVRELWKILMQTEELKDIFSENVVDINDFQIDHFIPWSYVACDELWNLSPIKGTINLDKSNYLPPEEYIDAFVKQQKVMYTAVLEEKKRRLADINYTSDLLKAFEKCEEKHVWAVWANEELYIDAINDFEVVLRDNIMRIYKAAKDQGYGIWKMDKSKW